MPNEAIRTNGLISLVRIYQDAGPSVFYRPQHLSNVKLSVAHLCIAQHTQREFV